MSTRALYDYTKFPSRSAQENYGDDILVSLWQKDDTFFAAPLMLRVPKAMTWKDFYQTQFLPYVNHSPRTKAGESYIFELTNEPFSPEDDKSLEELGVEHKNVLSFVKA